MDCMQLQTGLLVGYVEHCCRQVQPNLRSKIVKESACLCRGNNGPEFTIRVCHALPSQGVSPGLKVCIYGSTKSQAVCMYGSTKSQANLGSLASVSGGKLRVQSLYMACRHGGWADNLRRL